MVLIVDIWHPGIAPHLRRGHLDHTELQTFDAIVRNREPLTAMTERELSDGSVRRIRGD